MEPVLDVIHSSSKAASHNSGIEFARRFFNRTFQNETTFITTIRETYLEVTMYHGEVHGSPDGIPFNGTEGDKEKMRTEQSFLCLYWIWNDDYLSFTECQEPAKRLKPETFQLIRQRLSAFLATPELVNVMMTTMAIHDLGKCAWFSDAVYKASNHLTSDHDVVLHNALVYCPDLLPSYMKLSSPHQKLIRDAWELGFNVGQFVQGECLPFNLLKAMEKREENPECLNFFFCHELLDVAGVMGHVEPRGSKILDEMTMKGYQLAWQAFTSPDNHNALEVYEKYLWSRGPYFGIDAHNYQVAARRLVCLARLDGHNYQVLRTVTEAIIMQSNNLISELNMTGLKDQKAILIYYAPHLIAKLIERWPLQNALYAGLSLLEAVYEAARKLPENTPEHGVLTVNVREMCKIIAEDPDAIDKDITIDPITKMARFVLETKD